MIYLYLTFCISETAENRNPVFRLIKTVCFLIF